MWIYPTRWQRFLTPWTPTVSSGLETHHTTRGQHCSRVALYRRTLKAIESHSKCCKYYDIFSGSFLLPISRDLAESITYRVTTKCHYICIAAVQLSMKHLKNKKALGDIYSSVFKLVLLGKKVPKTREKASVTILLNGPFLAWAVKRQAALG